MTADEFLRLTLWNSEPWHPIELAEHSGHKLKVRHLMDGGGIYQESLAYVDGRFVGKAPNMEKACRLIHAVLYPIE